jgi:predicted DNA binding protein
MLKVDYLAGMGVFLVEMVLRENRTLDGIRYLGSIEILNILKTDGNKHICLIKYIEPEETIDEFRETDLDLIHAIPTVLSRDKFVISYIGEDDNLRSFVEMSKNLIGEVEKITFQRAGYDKKDLISILTPKQKEVVIAAQKYGYYEVPKNIRSEDLAGKLDLSKPVLLEHLRKAERTIMNEITGGYS